MGEESCVNQNNIQKVQNRTFREITFKKPHNPVNPLYKDLKVLKLKDLLHLPNCLFVSQIGQNQTLAKSFVTVTYCGDNHIYQARASNKRPLDTLPYKRKFYGTHCTKYHCIVDCKQFKMISPNLSETILI